MHTIKYFVLITGQLNESKNDNYKVAFTACFTNKVLYEVKSNFSLCVTPYCCNITCISTFRLCEPCPSFILGILAWMTIPCTFLCWKLFFPSSEYNGMHHQYSALSRKQLGIGEFAALSLSFLCEKLGNGFSSISTTGQVKKFVVFWQFVEPTLLIRKYYEAITPQVFMQRIFTNNSNCLNYKAISALETFYNQIAEVQLWAIALSLSGMPQPWPILTNKQQIIHYSVTSEPNYDLLQMQSLKQVI